MDGGGAFELAPTSLVPARIIVRNKTVWKKRDFKVRKVARVCKTKNGKLIYPISNISADTTDPFRKPIFCIKMDLFFPTSPSASNNTRRLDRNPQSNRGNNGAINVTTL